jgi:hypothetical protein
VSACVSLRGGHGGQPGVSAVRTTFSCPAEGAGTYASILNGFTLSQLSFFNPSNPELLVKVVNGCGTNQKRWVFLSAVTNVGYHLKVLDTQTAEAVLLTSPDNNTTDPILDTSAFDCP